MSFQLPTINGSVPGFWGVEMRLPHTTTLAGAPFKDGFSQRPLRGRELRHLLAAMSKDVKGAFRCTCRGDAMSEKLGELSVDPWVLEPYQGYVDRADIAEADSYDADDHFDPAGADDGDGYEDMGMKALRALAKERDVAGARRKEDLIANLRAADAASKTSENDDDGEGPSDDGEGPSDDNADHGAPADGEGDNESSSEEGKEEE